MQRTGRSANMLSRLSNDRNSAGLNLSELQQGHSRRIHSRRGTQLGHVRFEKFISTAPRARCGPSVFLRACMQTFDSRGLRLLQMQFLSSARIVCVGIRRAGNATPSTRQARSKKNVPAKILQGNFSHSLSCRQVRSLKFRLHREGSRLAPQPGAGLAAQQNAWGHRFS